MIEQLENELKNVIDEYSDEELTHIFEKWDEGWGGNSGIYTPIRWLEYDDDEIMLEDIINTFSAYEVMLYMKQEKPDNIEGYWFFSPYACTKVLKICSEKEFREYLKDLFIEYAHVRGDEYEELVIDELKWTIDILKINDGDD